MNSNEQTLILFFIFLNIVNVFLNVKNQSFTEQKGIKMNYAVIDIGSNTIRLSVYKAEGESFILLFSDKANAGLAGYIKKKIMTKEGIDRACIALEKFKKLLSQFTVESVSVIATAALRNVDNSKEAVKEISDRTGYSVELISGHEEALLGYYGVLSEQRINEGYIIDIGGGSAEITYITKGMPSTAVSLPVGSLNLYSKFGKGFLPNEKEFRKMSEFVSDTLKNYCIDDYPKLQTAVCVGGTARAALRLINS